MTQNAQKIPRESLSSCDFLETDALKTDTKKKERVWKLKKALALGNLFHEKVRITFKNAFNEPLFVEASVWAVGAEYVSLKGGVIIPIRAIEYIDV